MYQENEKDLPKQCFAPSYVSALDDAFSYFYRRYMDEIGLKKKRLTRHDASKIMKAFTTKMADALVESRSGLLIRGLGYFVNYRHPFTFVPNNQGYRHLTTYRPIHISTEDSIFKYYMMDYHFSPSIEKRVYDRTKEGYRYLNMMMGVCSRDCIYLGAIPEPLNRRKKFEKQIKTK